MVNGRHPSLRLVFFGTPEFAVPSLLALLGSRHEISLVVTQPDRPRGRGHRSSEPAVKRLAREKAVPILQPDKVRDRGVLEVLTVLAPDLGVVVAYGQILPDPILQAPRLGLINVHASLLPRYRGAAPIQRAILAGEEETGVTILRIVRELDAGPIFTQVAAPIAQTETALDVQARLASIGAEALTGVVDQLAGGSARETPQDDRLATYAPRLTKEEGLIRWDRPSIFIHNAVRGLQPWPHAFTFVGPHRCIVLRSAVEDSFSISPPGTVLESHGERLTVSAGDGRAVRILMIQPEGRRPMSAQEFLAGHPVPVGTVFGAGPAQVDA